ncbi:MAG: hypothetical protein EYC69_01925 [Bacteroidetes bacterium]|nr:MAG: hypothetical protein EYC69_01925 [Bacteroidota bacterium]
MKYIQENGRSYFRYAFKILAFFIMSSVLYNCKKEDRQEPLIEILQPASLLSIQASDSIFLEAKVSDDNKLTQVSIQLLDQNQVSVSPSLVYHPQNNRFYINLLYPISNIFLDSGNYLLSIYASDGENTSRKAVEIQINAIPLERLKVLALCTPSSSVNVYSLDSALNHSAFSSVSGDYINCSINSRSKKLNILGRSSGDYSIIDAENGSLFNSISGLCPIASPCFEYLQSQNDLNFISYNDGNIKAFDPNGLQKFSIQQQGYFRPGASFLTDQYFFAELYYIAQQELRLGTFFYPSGVIRQEFPIDMKIMKMFYRSQDELYLFGHSSGNAVVETFNRQFNRTFPLRSFGTMKIHSVYELSAHIFYLCTDQGIWIYRAIQNQFAQIQSNSAQAILYDQVYNEFFISERNTVRVLDASTLLEKKMYTLPDSVVSVQILYNK